MRSRYLARDWPPSGTTDGLYFWLDKRGGHVAAGVPIGRANLAMATDSDIAQVATVRAGMGIGPFQIPLAARSVELHRVLPSFTAALELWVVTHPDLRDVPTFRAVVNGLLGGLQEYLSS